MQIRPTLTLASFVTAALTKAGSKGHSAALLAAGSKGQGAAAGSKSQRAALPAAGSKGQGAASMPSPAATTPAQPAASQLTPAQSARQKIDADYAKAKAGGTRVVADTSNGGRALDLSLLTDNEVAAVALNRNGSFTNDEKLAADGELGGRMWKMLAPFDTGKAGNTGVQAAVKAVYPTLSQDMRDALGWTPAMLAMGDRILAAAPSGKQAHSESILHLLEKGQQTPGALRIDIARIRANGQGRTVNLML